MNIRHLGVHVFSPRTDLSLKFFEREIKNEEKYRHTVDSFEQDVLGLSSRISLIPNEYTIIQYENAVSCFHNYQLDYSYLAGTLSSRRSAPVLICTAVCRDGVFQKNELQGVHLYWGINKKCIAEQCFEWKRGLPAYSASGTDTLLHEFAGLLPADSILSQVNETLSPQEIITTLEYELGIFLGSSDLESFTATCQPTKQYQIGSVFTKL